MEKMMEKRQKCHPPSRKTCAGMCLPGQCLNATCNYRLHHPNVLGHPDIEQEAKLRQQCIEEAKKTLEHKERMNFLKDERRKMGMESFLISNGEDEEKEDGQPQMSRNCQFSEVELRLLKTPDGAIKTMREPPRPSCMLEIPAYTPPSDDYNDLSRFLRISTMPGYSNNELVSEYHDNHNMAVWNNRKDIDPQLFKMKRDWLSQWGESNVKEQSWRKAWAEKFGSG